MSRAGTLGVVVAGGRGVRLGLGKPKAFAVVGGMTLLARAEALLAPLCGDVVIAAPDGLALPAHRFPRLADAPPAGVPLAGLVAGLSARPFERALALGVDFPLMRVEMLAALLERLGDRAAVIPAPGGVPQPLAAVYAQRALAPLAAALSSGERAVTAATLALDPLVVPDAELARIAGGLDCFFNLNTPGDLAEAERRLPTRAREAAPDAERTARTP